MLSSLKFLPLNLISMLKSKLPLSNFPLNINFNADFQIFNIEIPFIPTYYAASFEEVWGCGGGGGGGGHIASGEFVRSSFRSFVTLFLHTITLDTGMLLF